MKLLIVKYLVTSAVIIIVSEVAKRNDRWGAFLASLPLVTLMVLFWLYSEKEPAEKIANHAYYTFWYVIPTLPMFWAFPKVFYRYGFWPAIGFSILLTIICFGITVLTAKKLGVNLI